MKRVHPLNLISIIIFTLIVSCELAEIPTSEPCVPGSNGCFAESLPPIDGSTVELDRGPYQRPLTGGTLAVNDVLAVAADPDRARLWIIDLEQRSVVGFMQLEDGSWPGRVVLGPGERVYVADRGRGTVQAWSTFNRSRVWTQAACVEPRGLDLDDAGKLHVACADGELLTLNAQSGALEDSVSLQRDLRDVIALEDGTRIVTTFKQSNVLTIPPGQQDAAQRARPQHPGLSGRPLESNVAWRARRSGDQLIVLHQLSDPAARTSGSPYYIPIEGCDIVAAALTRFALTDLAGGSTTLPLHDLPLGVDFAISPQDGSIAIANAAGHSLIRVTPDLAVPGGEACATPAAEPLPAEPVAVAFWRDQPVVQLHSPGGLYLNGATIPFDDQPTWSIGYTLFHTQQPALLACASCHPEGGEDGRSWTFAGKTNRTQTLRGGILATAPLHWAGDLPTFSALAQEIMIQRMGTPDLSSSQLNGFTSWVNAIPALDDLPNPDPEAAARGQALFNDPTVACATCHSGAHLTDNRTLDVGTGEALQVPGLRNLWARAPFMHTGCAATLRDRFDPSCGGGDKHGVTSHLTEDELSDLVAYLETL